MSAGTFTLPSGRSIRTRTKARYIVVADGRPEVIPYVAFVSNDPEVAQQRRIVNLDIVLDTHTGEVVR